MAFSAKQSLINWTLLIVIALLLWYRNIDCDRVVAAFTVTLAMIQLIEYGIYSGMNNGANLFSSVLLLQIIVLAVAAYVINYNNFSLYWLIISVVICLYFGFDLLFNKLNFKENDCFIQYQLPIDKLLYILLLLVPILLILYKTKSLYLLLILMVSSILFFLISSSKCDTILSSWSYSLIAVVLLAWIIGSYLN